MSECSSLPVLMYHYISHYGGPITVSPQNFEAQCRGMAEAGWHGIALDEAESFLLEGKPLPKGSVLITFDDGFLDNYVYAYPILKKYGHKGVIFAVTERLQKDSLDPTPSDGVGKYCATHLSSVDNPMHKDALGYEQRQDIFLSWKEAREMEASGVISIAAHSARHLAVYSAPIFSKKPSQLRQPTTHKNTFYIVDAPMLWGMPRFRERPALYTKAFLPSSVLLDVIRAHVPQDDKEAQKFFQNPQKVKHLMRLISNFKSADIGRMETDEEWENRIRRELTDCATTLKKELGHAVRSLCWPWGRGSDLAIKVAKELGFSIFFETRMGANPPQKPEAVHRFKVRDYGWSWLRIHLNIYARSWLAKAYVRIRI